MVKLNPKKMKVAELKSELEARDIQMAKGMKKADLVVLLTSALEQEGDGEDLLFSEEDADASLVAESDAATGDDGILAEADEPSPVDQVESQEVDEKAEEETESYEKQPEEAEPVQETEQEPVEEPEEEEKMETEESIPEVQEEPVLEQMENGNIEEPTEVTQEPTENGDKHDEPADATPDEGFGSAPAVEDSAPSSSVDPTPSAEDDTSQTSSEKTTDDKPSSEGTPDADAKLTPATDDKRTADDKEKHERPQDGHRSSENDHSSRKRRHDDRDRDRHRRYEERYAPPPEEPEEDFDDSLVVLDKYNSDLNMKLHRDRLTGQPLSLEGFAYLWAGARATYGVKSGKVCFECKLKEEHSVRQVPSSEPNRHLVRLGWSSNIASLLVGEDDLSYAYCGTGKVVTNKTVADYGETFKEGDVVGCYLDRSGEENVTMTFTKNGASLGVAFTVENEKLADVALFPHVLGKNTTLEMNFGEKEEPYFPHPEGLEDYIFIASVPLEERIRGTVGATARKDCEVLMMIGLPGSGKTHWANKHAEENQSKNYSILGTNAILQRMKVSGVESKAPLEVLMIQASSCLNRLSQVACRKKRNFILDQTNVFSSAQRRRMRTFEGYQRKAIVVVPSKEEFKIRLEKHTKEEGKDVPEHAMFDMKANFNIPSVGDLFEEVIFVDSEKEAVNKLIEEYRDEARKKGPPPEKRFRGGFDGNRGGRGGWGMDNRNMGGRPPFRGGGNFGRFGNQRGGGGGFRDGGDNRRGGGGGGWNNKGGSGGGNWQQNRNLGGGRGGFHGGNRGNYGGGNRSGSYNNQNRNSGNNNRNQGNRSSYQQNNQQGNRSNYNQNRNQNRGGGATGGSSMGQNRGGNMNTSGGSSYQHQAYQQQAAQFSSQTANTPMTQQYQQSYTQQQSQQPDYSQQWAQYYQQQAAVQQQQAAVAAQYQNYYANYQNAYAGQQTPQPPQ